MYCTNCGKEIDDSKFCPYCGTKAENQTVPVQQESVCMAAPSLPFVNLPDGILVDENGVLHWAFSQKDYTYHFFMDDKRIGLTLVANPKPDTVGQAFRDMVKSGVELVATHIVMTSEAYNGMDLPWNSNGSGQSSSYLMFEPVRIIKGNPKKSEILIKQVLSAMQLCMTPEQYPFVLDYVMRHCPQAKLK